MSLSYFSARPGKRVSQLLIFLMAFLVVLPVFAADAATGTGGASGASGASGAVSTVSAQDMINRIVEQLPSLTRLVTAFAYVMGMWFIILSMMKFKRYGEMRTMMSAQHHLREPMTYLVVGALLLYLPSSVNVGLSTFWAEPSPYSYLEDQDQWAQFINNCFMVVQFFGVVAFVRGLAIIAQLGGQGGAQGAFGRGITHIIGGLFCINIYQFVQVILFTLGIQTS